MTHFDVAPTRPTAVIYTTVIFRKMVGLLRGRIIATEGRLLHNDRHALRGGGYLTGMEYGMSSFSAHKIVSHLDGMPLQFRYRGGVFVKVSDPSHGPEDRWRSTP